MKTFIPALLFLLFSFGNAFGFDDIPTTVRIEITNEWVEVYEAHTNKLLFEYKKGEKEYQVFIETKMEADYIINSILEEDFDEIYR